MSIKRYGQAPVCVGRPWDRIILFHLGAGPGGITEFCNRYRDSFHRWWDDVCDVELTPELVRELSAGLQAECGEKDVAEKSRERDALIVGMLRTMTDIR